MAGPSKRGAGRHRDEGARPHGNPYVLEEIEEAARPTCKRRDRETEVLWHGTAGGRGYGRQIERWLTNRENNLQLPFLRRETARELVSHSNHPVTDVAVPTDVHLAEVCFAPAHNHFPTERHLQGRNA